MPHRRSESPRPFYEDWPYQLQEAAQAFWHWHLSLAHAQPPTPNGTPDSRAAFFEAEQERARAGEPVRMIPDDVCQVAYRACERFALSTDLLALQVAAARRLEGRVRFETTSELNSFVQQWAVPLGRLLAGLADADHKWALPKVDELARGFFFVGRLMHLARDLEQDRLFIALEDLEQADVTVDQLRDGRVDERMRRLLWKQSIRARDALAQGQDLIRDLPRRYRWALTRWWLGALEMLDLIERRDYDVWSRPPELSWFRKAQVYLQSVLGRAATHSR